MDDRVIVVGIDGSPGAGDALRWAVRHAERSGSPVRAVMSWRYPTLMLLPSPFGQAVPPAEAMTAATAESLAGLVDPIAAGTAVAIEQLVVQGAAAPVLLTEAESAALVVVGSRGLGRAEGVLRGSVSRRVVAASPCPVAVIPPAASGDGDDSGPVVVGVDGSESSIAALRWAGSATDGPIHAIHVIDEHMGAEYARADLTADDVQRLAIGMLERAVDAALGPRPDVTCRVLTGDARAVLNDVEQGASMLVVGARGATGIEGLVVGSVATSLASQPAVPLVVVPH